MLDIAVSLTDSQWDRLQAVVETEYEYRAELGEKEEVDELHELLEALANAIVRSRADG